MSRFDKNLLLHDIFFIAGLSSIMMCNSKLEIFWPFCHISISHFSLLVVQIAGGSAENTPGGGATR